MNERASMARVTELPEFQDRHIEAACQEIDAAFFSGDSFLTEEAMRRMEYFIGRWQREMAGTREMLKEEGKYT
jgi:hypothetical protein